MPKLTVNNNYPAIPILKDASNLDEWRTKVVVAFTVNEMGDYLFDKSITTTPEKMELGMKMLIPSLDKHRDYLSEAGFNLSATGQNPRALFHFVMDTTPKRKDAVQIHDILYKLMRVEANNDSPVAYLKRIEGMRDSLKALGYNIREHFLITAFLHGLQSRPLTKGWVATQVELWVDRSRASFAAFRAAFLERYDIEANAPKSAGNPVQKSEKKVQTGVAPAKKGSSSVNTLSEGQQQRSSIPKKTSAVTRDAQPTTSSDTGSNKPTKSSQNAGVDSRRNNSMSGAGNNANQDESRPAQTSQTQPRPAMPNKQQSSSAQTSQSQSRSVTPNKQHSSPTQTDKSQLRSVRSTPRKFSIRRTSSSHTSPSQTKAVRFQLEHDDKSQDARNKMPPNGPVWDEARKERANREFREIRTAADADRFGKLYPEFWSVCR